MSARCYYPDCGAAMAFGCMGCMREADDWPDGLHQVSPRYAYRDTAYPERGCDHCGEPYRGPAVYCSLDCALADA